MRVGTDAHRRRLDPGLLSYNHDRAYAALVLQRAKTYGLAIKQLGTAPTTPPDTSAPLPPETSIAKGVAGAPPTAPPVTAPASTRPSRNASPTTTPSGSPHGSGVVEPRFTTGLDRAPFEHLLASSVNVDDDRSSHPRAPPDPTGRRRSLAEDRRRNEKLSAMTPKSFLLTDDVHHYLVAHAAPIDEVQRSLVAETESLGSVSSMQIAPEQGALLTLLAGLVGARQAIEVGTFTGYSSIAIARGLVDGGRLLCCDVSEEWTSIARKAWAASGLEDRIELRLGPALATLEALAEGEAFDMAFIDADKGGYAGYYEQLVPRLRPGGILLADNTLWGGDVVRAPTDTDSDDVRALRAFNDRVSEDARMESVLLPVADGLTLARKR